MTTYTVTFSGPHEPATEIGRYGSLVEAAVAAVEAGAVLDDDVGPVLHRRQVPRGGTSPTRRGYSPLIAQSSSRTSSRT
jgi:hypothetical protein